MLSLKFTLIPVDDTEVIAEVFEVQENFIWFIFFRNMTHLQT